MHVILPEAILAARHLPQPDLITMKTTEFIYIADPMCSWCYGFGKELHEFLQDFSASRLEIVLGGLRAYQRQACDEDMATMILGHWQKVQQVSGLAFTMPGLMQAGFVYDTEPVCRAMVWAQMYLDELSSTKQLQLFTALQRAFYADAQDLTQVTVLARVLAEVLQGAEFAYHFSQDEILEGLQAAATQEQTRAHFQQVQQWGVRGFPVLLLVQESGLHMLANGYTSTAQLRENYRQVLASSN